MRNKAKKGDLSVQAIAGTHVVLLGMDLPEQKCPGLLGFALRREDHTEGEKYWLSGYKTFKSVEPYPASGSFIQHDNILFKVSRGRISPQSRTTITRMKCSL
jgi:hypothetical protein